MILNSEWDIIKYPVDLSDLASAQQLAEKMKEHRQNVFSRRVLKDGHDVQAILGERAFTQWASGVGFHVDTHDWVLTEFGDKFDFRIAGKNIDIKTRSTNYSRLDVLQYEVILDDPKKGYGNQIKKDIDYYVFTLYEPNHQRISLLGWITKAEFLTRRSYRFVDQGEPMWGAVVANQPVHLIRVEDLNLMRDLPMQLA